ncbi:Leucine-rich repeat and death domain-containing protein 1 [Taenia crassiceps]|uniref:Leucine-rich repeat and death domain-containing protein 1 n=1 Tax=Taenia crassiceps TaxID=6207 RepID=A0ABR4QFG7_9CEST
MHHLVNLNHLDLSDNKFSRFPIVVCYIPNLKVLLYNNCCHTCTYFEPDPPGWFDRTDLVDPNASAEKLGKDYIDETESLASENEELPTLEEALQLEEKASQIPEIKHEEISHLVFKRKPHRIPKLIYSLKFLVHLSLQNNGLYFLPNVFDKFNYLKRIYLNDNNLRKIPASIVACKTLTDIDLRNNKLTEVHGELHRLPNLKCLELDGNNFPPCLSEVIKHSDLKGLCAYLDASNQNADFILRQMCEKFISLASQDDWMQILQRLGVSEDTLEHIEDELPGGYNFRRRVTRALEYWSGMNLSTRAANFEMQIPGALNTEALTTTTAAIGNTSATANTTPSFGDAEILAEEPSHVLVPESSTMLVGMEAEISMSQPITLTFMPLVSGPKATPARLIHILKLLDKEELLGAMTEIMEKSHIRQL